MKILTINPGSTSTKIAVFEDLTSIFEKTLRHSVEELVGYKTIIDQYEFRKNIIIEALKEANIKVSDLDAVVGRGGLLKPIPGGVYRVSDAMIEDLRKGVMGEHASNIGGLLAREIARAVCDDCPSFIVDPVVVDEMDDIARYSGRPELPRISIFHALNQKAVARRFAREQNKRYEDLRLIVAHLGGGVTVGAHANGRVIDVNNGLDGDGPFSPERAGGLPSWQLTQLCYSGKYELHEMKKMITGQGGFVAYLNTNDARIVEDAALRGEEPARSVFFAMGYQVAKEIGSCAVALDGSVDAIIITGGVAYAKPLTKFITEKVKFIAPVHIYPGEDELQALAEGAYYAIKGELEIKEYA
ncbi:MAG: butyrate kinase [Chloroflexota bacterium]